MVLMIEPLCVCAVVVFVVVGRNEEATTTRCSAASFISIFCFVLLFALLSRVFL